MKASGTVPERAALPNGDSVTLRELFARFEGLRELIDERHLHYKELREGDSEAVDKAFKNSQTAIDKADAARGVHDATTNEWRQQLTDLSSQFLAKAEYTAKMRDLAVIMERLGADMTAFPSKVVVESSLSALSTRIQTLETARSEDLGRKAQQQGSKTENNAAIGLVIAALGMVGGLAVAGIGLALR